MRTIAFDSKEYHTSSGIREFYAPIGIGIETDDAGEYKKHYNDAMQNAIENVGKQRGRKAMSYEALCSLYPDDHDVIAEQFICDVRDRIKHIYFFYTQVDSKKTPFIYSKGNYKKLPPLEYIRIHQEAYPYWCAWRLSEESDLRNANILLDAFQGEETKAWNAIKNYSLSVHFKGDETNSLISTADIMLWCVDRKLRERKLNESEVKRTFDEIGFNPEVYFIGQPHYSMITSINTKRIGIVRYVHRPIFFVLHPSIPKGIEKKELERARFMSPIMDFPLNEAFEENACLKGFDYNQDTVYLRECSDIVLYYYGKSGGDLRTNIAELYHIPDQKFRKIPQ